MLKHTLTAAALAAVLATPAFAQAQQPTNGTKNSAAQAAPASQGTASSSSQNASQKNGMQQNAAPQKGSQNTAAQSNKTENPGQNDMAANGAKPQPASFMHSQTANEWRGTKLIGATVYGPDSKSIGDINDVLIAKDGQVTAVVVGVGGFLGVGEKNVALPFKALNVERKQDASALGKITVSYTKKQLKSAPRFTYYKGGATQTTGNAASESANTPMTPAQPGAKSEKK